MLEPDRRALLIDALRPPVGCAFDRAVGTTFTLDLDALLIAPVAFVLYDIDRDDQRVRIDPISLLEAVRRHADHIDLFCQAGEIRVPAKYQPILSQLEDSIHPVSAPQGGIFHPKVWAIRFVNADTGGACYRLLCMSRNLTFDRSWDVVLQLEGGPDAPASERTGEVARFLEALLRMAVPPPADKRQQAILQMAADLRRVGFAPPERCRSLRFHPLNLGDGHPTLRIGGGEKLAVISPFVSDRALQGLAGGTRKAVLISRQESLDALKPETREAFSDIRTLDPTAQFSSEEGEAVPLEEGARQGLSGLHAKVFVTERGSEASVYVGSANATDAAFSANVEFLAELQGHRRHLGIDALLGTSGDGSLADLLTPYGPSTPVEPSELDKAQTAVINLGHRLAAVPLTARVCAEGELYRLSLISQQALGIPAGVEVTWWPISTGPQMGLAATGGAPLALDFGRLSLASITSFFALQVRRPVAGEAAEAVFVVNSTLEGAPDDRRQQVLLDVLRSKHDFVRYLLLLLSDFTDSQAGGLTAALAHNLASTEGRPAAFELPLLESMVRTLSRDPARLDHVARLVDDLRARPEGQELLPEGFEAVWDPIWAAREALR